MVEVYWLTDTLQQKLSNFIKNWPLFCPLEGAWNQQDRWFAHIFEKSATAMIILVFAYTKWSKLIFFTLFCLISLNVVWKCPHFENFCGKSAQITGENGKFSIFINYLDAKFWQSSENISKCQNRAIVNHICFKKCVNSAIWKYPALLGPILAFWKKHLGIMGRTVVEIMREHTYIVKWSLMLAIDINNECSTKQQ